MFNEYRRRATLMFSAFVTTGLFMVGRQRTEDVAEDGESVPIEVAAHTNTIISRDTEAMVIDNDDGIPEVTNLG